MIAVSQLMLVTALLCSGADVLGDAPGLELRYAGTLARVTRGDRAAVQEIHALSHSHSAGRRDENDVLDR